MATAMGIGEMLMRIGLAIALGGLIGLERQSKHRPAGFRTHILVCVGSATVMVLSELMVYKYHGLFGTVFDPTRLGAQVISGIGFLGAGTIIHHRNNVVGLTTAAGLWVVAAIGLAVGAGFYLLAAFVAISILVILIIFDKVYRQIRDVSDVVNIRVELLNKPKTLGEINLLLARCEIKILDMEFINPELESETSDGQDVIYVRFVIKMNEQISVYTLMERINDIKGVIEVTRV